MESIPKINPPISIFTSIQLIQSMKNKLRLLTFILTLLLSHFTYGQEPVFIREKPSSTPSNKMALRDRIFISPDLGLQFGTVTLVMLAPKVGYRFTEKFSAGLGGTYAYIKDKSYPGYTFETNTYGGSIFAQYQIFENIRAYTEYEILNIELYDPYYNISYRENIPSLLVGGGYSQPLGGNSSFVVMALYNLLDGPKSIYTNPVIRIGFNIGF